MQEQVYNAREWLESRGLSWDTAQKIADRLRGEYPELVGQVKKAYGNAAELELIKLVDDSARGSFNVELGINGDHC